ncbi:hypothetical protein KDA00_01580 [Candidatus Saccharibacteria bacterium]|nr:hypothetical protein [Candidatus Saccharibacteria bacterium]
MTKQLAQLVGVQDQLFALMIEQLESASARPSIDIRLSTEIVAKVIYHERALGLDPEDTTGEELYNSLLSLVELHDSFLVKRLGGTNPADVSDMLPRIYKLICNLKIPKSVWVLKHSVAKKLIRSLPPKNVMKQLGYRSIDSMIKRESIDEIMIGTRVVESNTWHKNFIEKYKKLTPSDFESREATFLLLDGEKWGSKTMSYIKSHHQNITHLKEMGTIAILPIPINTLPGITIALLPRLLFYLNELRTYSTYFKHQQVHPGFGLMLVNTLLDDPSRHVNIAGQHLHWRIVHRHFGSGNVKHPDFFEPHIRPDDLFWRKAEDILYKIEPALHFWYEMDYVGVYANHAPVSFNLMDLTVDYINKRSYSKRTYFHIRESLWNELFVRYLQQESVYSQLRMQINHQVMEPLEL